MMTAEQLKASILQMAMQGKLVEQRPEEGTGEELYRDIQAEKKRLIKEKKIKKQKSLPEISEDEIPFDIPESWKWVRLGNIGSWSSGATPSRSKSEYYGGNIPWLKTGDLNDGFINEVSESITQLALANTSVRINPVGSILMAMYGATIGKLGIANIPLTTNQACCACIPYKDMYNKYIFYYLLGMRRSFIKMGEGGAQPNISKEKIINSLIALPPIKEQKRIVSKIEELMPFVDQYAAASIKLNTLNTSFPDQMKKSILQEAIQGKLVPQDPNDEPASELLKSIAEEKKQLIKEKKIKKQKPLPEITDDEIPFDIPESWEWVRLAEISKKITDGEHSTPKRIREFCGYYLLSARNIHNGIIKLDHVDFIDEIEFKRISARCNPMKGDILISCSGSVGRCTVVNDDNNYAMVRSAAMVSTIKCDPFYLMYAIQSECVQKQINALKKQTAQANLFLSAISVLKIPLPPYKEQKRIVDKLSEMLHHTEKTLRTVVFG